MKKVSAIWNRLINTGIDDTITQSEATHIRINNAVGAITSIWLYSAILSVLPQYPATKPIIINFIVSPTLWIGVIILSKYKKFLASKIWNAFLACFSTVWTCVLLGPESHNQLHYVTVIIGIMFIFSWKERRFMYLFIAISILCFIGLEVWFIENGPMMYQSAENIEVNRWITLLFLFLVVFLISQFNRNLLRSARGKLIAEKAKAEELLLNILPKPIAQRLKSTDSTIADNYADATIIFANIVNFRKVTEGMSASQLVEMLDNVFSEFDTVTLEHGLEKIKTIGSVYMAAGGVPLSRPDHCEAVADFALNLIAYCKDKFEGLELQIGINTGPVVGGVIGKQKFSYDLWGDTVNTADRMKSYSLPGKIQVTEQVYHLLYGKYNLEHRGSIAIKGKGEMKTWFLLPSKFKNRRQDGIPVSS